MLANAIPLSLFKVGRRIYINDDSNFLALKASQCLKHTVIEVCKEAQVGTPAALIRASMSGKNTPICSAISPGTSKRDGDGCKHWGREGSRFTPPQKKMQLCQEGIQLLLPPRLCESHSHQGISADPGAACMTSAVQPPLPKTLLELRGNHCHDFLRGQSQFGDDATRGNDRTQFLARTVPCISVAKLLQLARSFANKRYSP